MQNSSSQKILKEEVVKITTGNPINVDSSRSTAIVNLVSISGVWGEGFSSTLEAKWPQVKKSYLSLCKAVDGEFLRGQIQVSNVATNTFVISAFSLEHIDGQSKLIPDLLFKSMKSLRYKAEKDKIEVIVFPSSMNKPFIIKCLNVIFKDSTILVQIKEKNDRRKSN